MLHGQPATGQEEYMCIKLHKDTHHLWTERKQLRWLKSDNEDAFHFLNLPSAFPVQCVIEVWNAEQCQLPSPLRVP